MSLRPKRGDTEEDLIRFQREFLAKQEAPSAIVIKRKASEGQYGAEDRRVSAGADGESQLDDDPTASYKFPGMYYVTVSDILDVHVGFPSKVLAMNRLCINKKCFIKLSTSV